MTRPNSHPTQGITNPLFSDHVGKKAEHTMALVKRVPVEVVERLLAKDLALHAAITYYAAVTQNGASHPPRGETIIRTAETFEEYYHDVYEAD